MRYVQTILLCFLALFNAHGLTGELAFVKSYVYEKYVHDQGEFLVNLVWWVETIDGYIWEEGGATVRLPSRNSN